MHSDLNLIETQPAPAVLREPWQVMVVDDDIEVHDVTRLALGSFEFGGRPLRIHSAYSGAEAKRTLASHPDTALLLLDVVMESDHAGLDVVRYVREELKNRAVRVVLRTGQAGQSPPRDVVARYEVDDFRNKADLTVERLNVLVTTALRTYTLIRGMETYQRELARAKHELERFVHVASHDLGAPVQDILNCSRLLLDQAPPGDPAHEEISELANFITGSAEELRQIIGDLLQYSRFGRVGADGVAVDINEVVERACRQLQWLIDQRGARIDIEPLPTGAGEPVQLDRLFLTLIENALESQPEGNPEVSISAQPAGRHWEIRVRDRGMGLERHQMMSLFADPPLDGSVPPQRGGTGLAMCRRIASLHGGDIRAESQPGEGTTFIVTLPVH